MTLVPPFEEPTDQVNPITDLVVIKGSFNSETGASGTNTVMPPFPLGDYSENP